MMADEMYHLRGGRGETPRECWQQSWLKSLRIIMRWVRGGVYKKLSQRERGGGGDDVAEKVFH